jgi:subtilisin family serine protease
MREPVGQKIVLAMSAVRNGARPGRVLGLCAVAGLLLGLSASRVWSLDLPPARAIVSPALRADLVVKNLRLDVACRIVVTVANVGRGTVPDSIWAARTASGLSVTVDGKPFAGAPIWSFDPARKLQAPGGSVEFVTMQGVTGSVTVEATIDDNGQIPEADENNNRATAKLFCANTRVFAPGLARTRETSDGGAAEVPTTSDGVSAGAPANPERAPDVAPPPDRTTAGGGGGQGSLLQAQLPRPPADMPPPPRQDKTIEPGELVVVSATMAEAQSLAQQAQALGLGIKRRTNLTGLRFVVTVLRVPKEMGIDTALTALRQSLPKVWADANHRYELHGSEAMTYGHRLIGLEKTTPLCGGGVRLGLVDTAIDMSHAALRGRDIARRSFLPTGIPQAAPDHGTAVSALLVGNRLPSGFGGLVPGAKVYAAAVFRDSGNGADTTAEWIVQALDWLVQQRVEIINLSFGGPRNLLLEAAIDRLVAGSIVLVAAAGNQGPDAPPSYPAANRGVLAVTAVDAALKPWSKANRGHYISYSAPGVDVWSALPGKDGAYLSGTSYAAPFVAAALAAVRQSNPKRAWSALQRDLQTSARDLGDKGKDPVYGWGLVQSKGCGTKAAQAR